MLDKVKYELQISIDKMPMRDRTETLDIPLRPIYSHGLSSSPSYSRQISNDQPRGVERMRLQIVDFEMEIDRMNSKAVQSTRNMVKDIEEATDSGIRTLACLEEQDEALDRIDADLEQISSNIGVMRKHLRRMQSCCGLGHYYHKYIRAPIARVLLGRRVGKHGSDSSGGSPLVITLPQREYQKTVVRRDSKRSNSIQREHKASTSSEEKEIEKNLERVDAGVRTLKEVAFDIHTQLEIQKPKINHIQQMVEENELNIGASNRVVRKMLSK